MRRPSAAVASATRVQFPWRLIASEAYRTTSDVDALVAFELSVNKTHVAHRPMRALLIIAPALLAFEKRSQKVRGGEPDCGLAGQRQYQQRLTIAEVINRAVFRERFSSCGHEHPGVLARSDPAANYRCGGGSFTFVAARRKDERWSPCAAPEILITPFRNSGCLSPTPTRAAGAPCATRDAVSGKARETLCLQREHLLHFCHSLWTSSELIRRRLCHLAVTSGARTEFSD